MAQGRMEDQGRSLESESVQVWLRRYEENGADFSTRSLIPPLEKYNAVLYDKLSEEVGRHKGSREPVRIWSAGSGYDFVSLKLKLAYSESVDLTIYDVSPQCIESNKQVFSNFGVDASFVVGNLFDSDYKGEFDVVTNTGLLEHFSQVEQRELIGCFSRSLKPGGSYLTLVPYAGAKLYNVWMRRSKRIGAWKYGPENPLSDLKSLENSEMSLIEEFPVGAAHQLYVIPSMIPVAGSLLKPAIEFVNRFDRIFEPILMKVVSGYCLFGKFEKKRV